MLENILLSFIGSQDPLKKDARDGPILTIAGQRQFHRIILFHTQGQEIRDNASLTAQTLRKRQPGITIDIQPLPIEDPTSHLQILTSMRGELRELLSRKTPTEYFVAIASGTCAMHACWLLLTASGEIPANILYQRESKYVKNGEPSISEIDPRVRPFPRILPNITMDDLPDITNINLDEALKQAGIIGDSPVLCEQIENAVHFAQSASPVLIAGETGTGKELFATFIHNVSKRCGKGIITIDCGAIASGLVESELFGHVRGAFTTAIANKSGKFELANGGTLFLDEIGELPLLAQVKLLRFLEKMRFTPVGDTKEKKVDVRIIAASNRNLEDEVKKGTFREDLLYRLNIFTLTLPPLRERGNDIDKIALMLLNRHVEREKKPKSFTLQALAALRRHAWPGNVRELRNVIARAYQLTAATTIDAADLQLSSSSPGGKPTVIPELSAGFSVDRYFYELREKIFISALEKSGGKQKEAAKLLGITPQAMSKFIKQHGLNRS